MLTQGSQHLNKYDHSRSCLCKITAEKCVFLLQMVYSHVNVISHKQIKTLHSLLCSN